MFGNLLSKAASNLPQIPFLSKTGDVKDRVCSIIPDVPSFPTTVDLSDAVRRAGESVLGGVENQAKYVPHLAEGVNYLGSAASSLPFIGSSIRPFFPEPRDEDTKEEKEDEDDTAEDSNTSSDHGERPQGPSKVSIEDYWAGWNFLQDTENPLTSASSVLSSLLPSNFSGLSLAMTRVALQTSISTSVMTLGATNNLFQEYNRAYSRVLSNSPAFYCREKSALEATQYFIRFAISNLSKLYACSPKEIIRALAMYGALQKVLGTPYPPTEPILNTNTMEGRVEFKTLQRVYDFVLASYGPLVLDILRMNLTGRSMDELIIRITGVRKEDILLSCSTSKFQQPAYAVVMDHKHRRIVVTVRGTANVADCLTDIHGQVAPFHVGHAHQGMLCSAQYLDRKLRDLVRNVCRSNKEYEIVIAGHSLGGAVATILAIMWHKDRIIGMKVRGISYAAASCVSKPLAEDSRAFVTSVVYADDIISRISLRSFEILRHILVMMCSKEGKEEGVDTNTISSLIEAYITAERRSASRCRNHLQVAYTKLTSFASKQSSDHPLIYPGGQIRYVIPDEDYTLHPERRPLSNKNPLMPHKMYMLVARNLDSLGEIVCNPAVCLRHFPTVLNDFFRPRDLGNIMAGNESDVTPTRDEDAQFCYPRGRTISMETDMSGSEDEKMELGTYASYSSGRSTLTPRRRSFQNIFCIRRETV